ncbi:lipocalin-like domain-containing protein [Sphaerotilus mobilis]|uniref:Putative secreted hydrolase n=1 Tax=Sphaerotilus mobilis TaxID=47994 RepID=A0A4Q7LT83_9BURK|nr:lipocalin-like domain-containing protein [Sphaerotilus mobilis]RZS58116.1 putative secreted hydrolase [Sphaerotilus mobilis]
MVNVMPPSQRRTALAMLAQVAWAGPALASRLLPQRPPDPVRVHVPVDFGAHPDQRIEWWYLTGWLADPAQPWQPLYGIQLTFFRSRTEVRANHPSAFAATQLVMAHAALSDVRAGRLVHDQRIARANLGQAVARVGDTEMRLRDWSLRREAVPGKTAEEASVYRIDLGRSTLAERIELIASTTSPILRQGLGGWSRKGPDPSHASLYYSQPQLTVQARLRRDGRDLMLTGRAWMDHEWSDSLLPPEAVGWDWIGINRFNGDALTAFRLRRHNRQAVGQDPADATLWTGGSLRQPSADVWYEPTSTSGHAFRHEEADVLRWTPLRHWTSPSTQARYPVEWKVERGRTEYTVRALFDAQELDSRASTGTVYWEGLSELLDADGRQRLGLGYLEMTGYAQPLTLR